LWVFTLIAVFGFYSNWVIGLVSGRDGSLLFLIAASTSALLWPVLFIMMKSIQMRFRLTKTIYNSY
jgi:cell shape-determining protein MreD